MILAAKDDDKARLAALHSLVARSAKPTPALLSIYVQELSRVGGMSAEQIARICKVLRRTVFVWRAGATGPTKRRSVKGLRAYAKRASEGVTAPELSAAQLIGSSMARDFAEQDFRPHLRTVLQHVASHFGLTVSQLKSRSRTELLCTARATFVSVAIESFHFRQAEVGAAVGRSQAAVSRMLEAQC